MTRGPAVLSVDFEFFSHTAACRAASGEAPADVGRDAMDFLLDLFDRAGVEATFFVVSEVAERSPEVVERAADHEIASHTHTHRHLSELDAAERRTELVRSAEILERVSGARVSGFRAPSFDFGESHFRELDAAGYEYDSSVAPCRSVFGFYEGSFTERRPGPATRFDPDAPADLAELPIGVSPGLRLPISGAWLRLFGLRYTLAGMWLLARRGIAPVLYVHPWELVDLPAVEGVPRRVYWRTGPWMRRAIERVVEQPFEFVTARDLLREHA